MVTNVSLWLYCYCDSIEEQTEQIYLNMDLNTLQRCDPWSFLDDKTFIYDSWFIWDVFSIRRAPWHLWLLEMVKQERCEPTRPELNCQLWSESLCWCATLKEFSLKSRHLKLEKMSPESAGHTVQSCPSKLCFAGKWKLQSALLLFSYFCPVWPPVMTLAPPIDIILARVCFPNHTNMRITSRLMNTTMSLQGRLKKLRVWR